MIRVPGVAPNKQPMPMVGPHFQSIFDRFSIRHQSKWMPIYFLIASALLAAPKIQAETLREYAARCDLAIGETVPDFECDEGTEVLVTNATWDAQGGRVKCDTPNHLHDQCDPGSRFKVLKSNGDAYIVGLC